MSLTPEQKKEALADLLREYPTWADAALALRAENAALREALWMNREYWGHALNAAKTDCILGCPGCAADKVLAPREVRDSETA